MGAVYAASDPSIRTTHSAGSWYVPKAWLVVFGSAVLSGWLVSLLFRAHRAAAVLSLAAAMVVAGAILLPNAIDLGPLALGSVVLLDALAAVGGGSLTGVRKRTVRG